MRRNSHGRKVMPMHNWPRSASLTLSLGLFEFFPRGPLVKDASELTDQDRFAVNITLRVCTPSHCGEHGPSLYVPSMPLLRKKWGVYCYSLACRRHQLNSLYRDSAVGNTT